MASLTKMARNGFGVLKMIKKLLVNEIHELITMILIHILIPTLLFLSGTALIIFGFWGGEGYVLLGLLLYVVGCAWLPLSIRHYKKRYNTVLVDISHLVGQIKKKHDQ